MDADGAAHKVARSPYVEPQGSSPPEQTPELQAALRKLAKELRDDGWKPFWLDTLAIEPGQTQRIAFAAEYAGCWLLESVATDWAAPRLVRCWGDLEA